jgi:hypothetical protein
MDDAAGPLKVIKRVPDHSVDSHRVPRRDMALNGCSQNSLSVGFGVAV